MWRRHADARHLGIAIDGDLRKHCAPGVRTERGAVLTWFRRPLRLNWLITIALNKCCECVRLRCFDLLKSLTSFAPKTSAFNPCSGDYASLIASTENLRITCCAEACTAGVTDAVDCDPPETSAFGSIESPSATSILIIRHAEAPSAVAPSEPAREPRAASVNARTAICFAISILKVLRSQPLAPAIAWSLLCETRPRQAPHP